MNLKVAVAGPLFAQAKTITLPTQFADIISFAIIAVLAGCSVTAMIKIGMGFKQWIRGEDAFAEIKSGFLIAGVPWAVQAAFNGVGVYEKLGIPMVPKDALLPSEMQTLLQYGLWIIIALFLAIAMYVGLEGAQKTSRGEDGMRMSSVVFPVSDRSRPKSSTQLSIVRNMSLPPRSKRDRHWLSED